MVYDIGNCYSITMSLQMELLAENHRVEVRVRHGFSWLSFGIHGSRSPTTARSINRKLNIWSLSTATR
jgi:hypothetical protein